MASEAARPTRKQLSYLRRLAEQTGTTFTPPATRADASREIERLKARPTTPAAEPGASAGPCRTPWRAAGPRARAARGSDRLRQLRRAGPATTGGRREAMREPIDYAGAFLVEHAVIPPELTIAQWRGSERASERAAREQARGARRRAWLLALVTVAHGSAPGASWLSAAARRPAGRGAGGLLRRSRCCARARGGAPREGFQ